MWEDPARRGQPHSLLRGPELYGWRNQVGSEQAGKYTVPSFLSAFECGCDGLDV